MVAVLLFLLRLLQSGEAVVEPASIMPECLVAPEAAVDLKTVVTAMLAALVPPVKDMPDLVVATLVNIGVVLVAEQAGRALLVILLVAEEQA
jgi:hypothetical protein